MWKTYIKLIIISGFIYWGIVGHGYAQSTLSSPYSAFGLGQLYQSNNMRNSSMGGIGIGTRDYFTVNVKNPASYTAFDSTSFVFEGSLKANITTMSTQDFSEDFSYATLDHLLFGFPVTNFWRSSFGLLPYSGIGYNVVDTDIDENIGKVQYNFNGEGGLSEFFWGNALRFGDHFSIGMNASYLFGSLDRIQRISFPDSSFLLNTKFNNSVSIKDFKFEFGAQYYTTLAGKLDFIAGAIYQPQAELSAKKSQLVRSYRGSVSGVDLIVDTVKMILNQKGNVILPARYGAGFSIADKNHWLFSIDYTFNNWQNYSSFGGNDSLVNSHLINIGGQIIPDANSLSYVKRIDYRAGFKYNISNLNFRDEQLNGFGITFGAGLPLRGATVRGSRSMINLGVSYGRYGTQAKGLIREDYVNFFVGISIYEWWFFKRRYK